MLSAEEWWGIMALYGAQVRPAQIVFYLAALGVTVLVFACPGSVVNNLMRLYLAAAFAWISIVFFLLIGRDLARSYVFGTLFGTVAFRPRRRRRPS